MRLLVVEKDVDVQQKWLEAVQPHWSGKIEQVDSNEDALSRLRSPYFFPVMVCLADRETILQARDRGIQRFVIRPCEPAQLIHEINQHVLDGTQENTRDAQVQLQVMYHTLNSLCHGPITHRQLQWLKQRCTGNHLHMARIAIDQIIRYMDRPNHKTAEIKNALMEISLQVQQRVDRVLGPQYA